MAVLPFRPTPFFADKNKAFWYLQLAGWGSVFLLRATNALANDRPVDLLVILLVTTITGFSISLVLSVIYRQLINKKPVITWGLTMLAFLGAFIVHVSIDTWVQGLYYPISADTGFVQRFVRLSYTPLTLLGGWSALYYAINYFLTVEEQADRLERLEAQATSAHLAMLRYQLNPHFLFNTLNSISTLVLLKHSMLLQPLIENAIKYAVSPQEEGARISLEARVHNGKLQVGVEDTGPGATVPDIADPAQGELLPIARARPTATTSTGVGLANIRNRLAQAYGDQHRFEITSNPSGGFSVFIEIPFEPLAEDSAQRAQSPNLLTSPQLHNNNTAPAPALAAQSPQSLG